MAYNPKVIIILMGSVMAIMAVLMVLRLDRMANNKSPKQISVSKPSYTPFDSLMQGLDKQDMFNGYGLQQPMIDDADLKELSEVLAAEERIKAILNKEVVTHEDSVFIEKMNDKLNKLLK